MKMKMAVVIRPKMMNNEKYDKGFILTEDWFLCFGKKLASVFNFNTYELFHLDYEAAEKFVAFFKNEKVIDDTFKGYNINFKSKEINNVFDFDDKKIQLKTVWLELRKACNLKCIHCYNDSNPVADSLSNILSIEQWKDIVNQLVEFSPRTIILVGGEPLLFKEINELIIFIRQKLPETVIILYSNLTLLSDKTVEVIKQNDVKVVTSLYSYNYMTHDKITQTTGSFIKTTDAIKLLMNNNVHVKANNVVMSTNEDDLSETISYITKLTGKPPKCDDIRCTESRLDYLKPKSQLRNHMVLSEKSFRHFDKRQIIRAINGNDCWQGKVVISADGSIKPCVMWCQNINETILNKKLYDILLQQLIPYYWKLSKDKVKVCSKCEYRYYCSDCRPLVQTINDRGQLCLYNPYIGKWSKDNKRLTDYINSKKVSYNKGFLKIAFVFSCPGKEEDKCNKVCSGQTGINLSDLISVLAEKKPTVFASRNKYDYLITNASDAIQYMDKDKRTEPLKSEILLAENLYRLEHELKDCSLIICMGAKATLAVSALDLPIKTINSIHCGNQSLNKKYRINTQSNSKERRIIRIEKLANEIIDSMD